MSVPIKTDWKICRLSLNFMLLFQTNLSFLKASSANALLWINAASNGFFHETWTPRYFTLVLTGTWCPFLKCRIGVSKRGSSELPFLLH